MVAGGLPTVQVLLDDGSGTFPYDISSKCRLSSETTTARGRSDEQSAVVAGTLTLTLNNTDGRFTPGSTTIASPSPIKTDAQIRVKETANAVTVTVFTGYVQSWPVAWPSGGQELSEVTVVATDAQARAERRVLRSVVEEEIMADSPAAYYTLGEPEGAVRAGDTSGGQEPALGIAGDGVPVTFGTATGPGTDGLTAASVAGGKFLSTSLTFASAPTTLAIGFFFTANGSPGTGLLARINAAGASGGPLLDINGSGKLLITDGSSTTTTTPVVNDGAVHHAFVVLTATSWSITVDGGTALTLGSVSGPTMSTSMQIDFGGTAFVPPSGHTLFGVTNIVANLSHLAVFTSAPSAARITAEATAGLTGFAGETDVARITRILGYAGILMGTTDTSLTNVPFVDFTGQTAWQTAQDVVDAAMGVAYINGSGTCDFHNRQKVSLKTTPDLTIDANQLDPGTIFTTDMQGVVNYFEATAQSTGVAQVASDATSMTNHGRYPESKTYLVSTDGEALDRANWVVYTHKEPGPRVGTLVIDLLSMTAAVQATWLAVEPDYWIQVTGLPSQTPGGTTANLIVQGWSKTLVAGGDNAAWQSTLNVADKPTLYPSVWILGDSTYGVLGSTTRLGV